MKAPIIAIAALTAFVTACDSHDRPAPTPPSQGSGVKAGVQDPVCGMQGEFKLKASHEGREVAFCSETCKSAFEKDPAKYKWGYCACAKRMHDCRCAHCTKNSEPCDCGKEKDDHHH